MSVLVFPVDQSPGIIDVGENHAGAAKNAIFKMDIVVYRDIVLDFAVITNSDLVANEYTLAK